MGTSQSYGGPGDVSQLLPAWAVPPTSPAATPGLAGEEPGAAAPEASPTPRTSTDPPSQHPWAAAKRSLGVSVRTHSGARDYSRAAGAYVRARGGASQAVRTLPSGRIATARLGGLLSAIAKAGLSTAVAALGLTRLTGRSATEVQAALVEALAPEGSTLEEAAARRAVADTISELYERYGLQEGGLERLESMTADQIGAAILDSVSAYIYYRWSQELGLAIERGAISAADAIEIEKEMRLYIKNTVQFDLVEREILEVDWKGDEGRKLVESVFLEAYRLIEV